MRPSLSRQVHGRGLEPSNEEFRVGAWKYEPSCGNATRIILYNNNNHNRHFKGAQDTAVRIRPRLWDRLVKEIVCRKWVVSTVSGFVGRYFEADYFYFQLRTLDSWKLEQT